MRGRSMVEMLGVLAIIGVLSVGGIAGYSKAMQKYRANKLTDQIMQTITNVQTIYAQQSTYANVSSISELVIPEEARGLLHIDNQEQKDNIFIVGFDFYDSLYGKENGYQYCVALASMDWKSALGDSLVGLTMQRFAYFLDISGPDMESYEGEIDTAVYVGADNLPLPLSKVAQYCKYYDSISGFTIHIKK